jgi:ribosomal protein S21
MLKRFKYHVQKSGVPAEYRERMFYTKPSEERRQKREEAKRTIERRTESTFKTNGYA